MESLTSFDLGTICSYLTYDTIIHLKLVNKMMYQLLRGVDANLRNILIQCAKTHNGKYWFDSRAQKSYKYFVRLTVISDFFPCDLVNIAIMTKDLDLFIIVNNVYKKNFLNYFANGNSNMAHAYGDCDIIHDAHECFNMDKKCIQQKWIEGFTCLCEMYINYLHKFAFSAQCSTNLDFYNIVVKYQHVSIFERKFE